MVLHGWGLLHGHTHAAALEIASMHACLLSRASRACCCAPCCAVARLTGGRCVCRRCMGRQSTPVMPAVACATWGPRVARAGVPAHSHRNNQRSGHALVLVLSLLLPRISCLELSCRTGRGSVHAMDPVGATPAATVRIGRCAPAAVLRVPICHLLEGRHARQTHSTSSHASNLRRWQPYPRCLMCI